MQNKKGFTLIELLVVIAIIGILSAIGLTALSGAQSKARDTKRKADLGALNSSLTLYFDSNNAFPIASNTTAAPNLGPITAGCTTCTNMTAASTAATNGFAVPKSPLTTNNGDYYYISDATGSMMGLFTKLENQPTGMTNAYFVVNSKGFSDSVTDANSLTTTAPASTNTECVASSPSATKYSPCAVTPAM